VQDLAVRPWEDEPLVAVPEPDKVRRGAVVAPDLQNLSGVVRRPHLPAVEEKPLTDPSLHVHHLLGIRIGAQTLTARGLHRTQQSVRVWSRPSSPDIARASQSHHRKTPVLTRVYLGQVHRREHALSGLPVGRVALIGAIRDHCCAETRER
jgi:hypothetical protein